MSRNMVDRFSKDIIDCFERGNKILVCGNGGSATMSSHFVGELVSKFEKEGKALPAISLTDNIAIITAIANDYSFDNIFSRQIEALGRKGDVLFILSTSGESKNCQRAELEAYGKDIIVRQFPVKDDRQTTAEIQEKHLKIIHEVCRIVENKLR
jgi:D-sedoheptulose 7-phosphate isomerase